MSEEYFIDGESGFLLTDDADSADVSIEDQPIPNEPALANPAEIANDRVLRRQDENKQPLYFDLETVPDYDRLASFNLPEVPPIPDESPLDALPPVEEVLKGTVEQVRLALAPFVCPAVYLDQLIAAEKASKDRLFAYREIEKAYKVRSDAMAAHDDRRKLLSTTPEYCKIVAMGWAVGGGPVQSVITGKMFEEKNLLATFWALASMHAPLVVYNGLHFDLPVIFVRSAMLGVASSRMIDTSPYGKDVLDLYVKRFGIRGNTDKLRPGKMKSLAKLYGVHVPVNDCDGSQVAELMRTDPVKVGEYVRSDVEVLRGMHRAMSGYFWK